MWYPIHQDSRYEVNRRGQVKGPSGKILKPTLLSVGYYSVALSLGNKRVIRVYVHKLVYETFNKPVQRGYVINHKNHNKLDNRLSNLEAVTRSDNGKHWREKSKHPTKRKRNALCSRGHDKNGKQHCNQCRKWDYEKPVPPNCCVWQPYRDTNYLISSCGKVWSKNHHKVLKPGTNNPGYLYVCLRISGKSSPKSLHRLVAETFIRKIKDGEIVDHINGDKKNNHVNNLRITSHSENIKNYHKRKSECARPL